MQAGRSGGAIVLAKRGSKSVHSIEPDQREHLSVLSCTNVDGGFIPNFYILKGSYLLEDYIARCEEGAIMGMQPNAWMIRWLFESWISHFVECMKRGPGLDQTNHHLLILEGHNSHVTLEVVKISMEAGLDIVSLSSHTTHALQPLDVACFAPFKIAFWKHRDLWSMRNKNGTIGKQELCKWTSKALHDALTPHNIKSNFGKTGIWPLNCMALTGAMTASQGFKDPGRIKQNRDREVGQLDRPVISGAQPDQLVADALSRCRQWKARPMAQAPKLLCRRATTYMSMTKGRPLAPMPKAVR